MIEGWASITTTRNGSAAQACTITATATRERVLVAGGSDSGLAEVLHYVFRDFSHNMIKEYFPAIGFDLAGLQQKLEETEFAKLVDRNPMPIHVSTCVPIQPLFSPALIWYLGQWQHFRCMQRAPLQAGGWISVTTRVPGDPEDTRETRHPYIKHRETV
jgi:hypothetical protein